MLVISRRGDEAIVIGESIRIRVISIEGRRVRLGIEAPRDVPIARGELLPTPPEDRPTEAA